MIDDFDSLHDEMVFDAVKEALGKDVQDLSRLESLGFVWVDDDNGQEELEEKLAKPENERQRLLLNYLEGDVGISESILGAYLEEMAVSEPNFPLFRRYFKRGNPNLKDLLMFGLESLPTNLELLRWIGFFHSNNRILGAVISIFKNACEKETDLGKFEEIALLFHSETEADGYDALHDLGVQFGPISPKGIVVDKIKRNLESTPYDVKF